MFYMFRIQKFTDEYVWNISQKYIFHMFRIQQYLQQSTFYMLKRQKCLIQYTMFQYNVQYNV